MKSGTDGYGPTEPTLQQFAKATGSDNYLTGRDYSADGATSQRKTRRVLDVLSMYLGSFDVFQYFLRYLMEFCCIRVFF